MNAYNHHRILSEVNKKLFKEALSDKNLVKVATEFNKNLKLFEFASDYSDDWSLSHNANAFFFYNFYYDIELGGKIQKSNGTILLKRSKEGDYKNSYINCDLGDNKIPSKPSKFKSFFTILNNREYWLKDDFFDKSNQSDCVAPLHAMAASVKQGNFIMIESPEAAKEVFIKHLKKCFAEYLLLSDDKEATIMLGIALHGIMDSFTPSHMDFQPYAIQDMALHAQGDVIPFRNDIVHFEPGQYTEDGVITQGKSKIAAHFKGYDGNNEINDIEFEMFKIFSVISGISDNEIIQSIINSKIDITESKFNFTGEISSKEVKYRSRKRLNDIIEENNIKYSDKSFEYSDTAIEVVKEVFKALSMLRNEKDFNYEKYKEEKKDVITKATKIWEEMYNNLSIDRSILFEQIRSIRKITNEKNPFAK